MMFKKVLIILILGSLISCNKSLSIKEKEDYIIKGKEIANASFVELSSQLMIQLKEGGPAQAIPFCNQEASVLINQLSDKYDVTIKRSSDQLRSCKIEPTDRELAIIYDYKKSMTEKKGLQPIVEIDENKKVHFYAPIIVKANCLVCHGKLNETLTQQTDSIIKSIYPFDIATGYAEGDLRGVWSITFKK